MAAGSTYTPIATTTLGSAQSSVTFSSLGSYTDLLLVFTYESSADSNLQMRFNGDTGSNYSFTAMYGDGSSAASNRGSSTTGIPVGYDNTSISGTISRVNIQNYTNSTTYKTAILRSDNSGYVVARVGLWRNTAAITSITLVNDSGNINSGSTFTLYGIAAA
jgi:hypothetical protein